MRKWNGKKILYHRFVNVSKRFFPNLNYFYFQEQHCMTGFHLLTLNRAGKERNSSTRIDKPMRVAILQWGMVGVKYTFNVLPTSFTSMFFCSTTFNCSRVKGCSGSLMKRIKCTKSSQGSQCVKGAATSQLA